MHRKAVAQALRRHALVQNREVHRVERRIAQSGQCGCQHQSVVALRHAGQQTRHGKAAERGKHHRPGTGAVHHKARQRLAHARDHKEHRHQQAQLGIAETEFGNQPGKQRRQQQVEKVRRTMRQPDQSNGARVLAQRHRSLYRQDGGTVGTGRGRRR